MSAPAVLEDLDTNWRADAHALLVKVAESGEVFDAYALESKHGLRPPRHPNLWGPLFQAASNAGLITYVEHRRSQRPSSNGSMRAFWRGIPNNTYRKAKP